jgi:5-methyltetrahydropteroyltriglutamate--homocysteine methyltransferase
LNFCKKDKRMPKPPYRADQVGSLLRPAWLKEARAQFADGRIDREGLREVEDRAIREVIALQESIGMPAVTDGEFRRALWHVDFLTGFDGVEATKSDYAVSFKGKGGEIATTSSMLAVTGKVSRSKPIMVDHFAFVKANAKQAQAKMCIPSPTYMHMRGGRKVVADAAYPDQEQFWTDMTAAYKAEIAGFVEAGCDYLQLDDVSFANLCDKDICAQAERDGLDPKKLPETYARIIARIIEDRPASLGVTMHTCRGNHDSMWMAEGGYEPIADAMFNLSGVDGFFLEYDTERAGDFSPLRFVPKGKRVVLGLISSKEAALEDKDMLKRRIDAAAKYVPLDQLCISPQCGFASTETGNRLTEDDEKRKLALVVEVAREVWGAPDA